MNRGHRILLFLIAVLAIATFLFALLQFLLPGKAATRSSITNAATASVNLHQWMKQHKTTGTQMSKR
jgi:hypothetical protein